MEQRALGRTGLQVSALGYGCGAIGGLMTKGDPAEQRRAVERALAAGITYFDTAPSYGDGRSETNLGRVLRELDAWGKVRVGTKVRLDSAHLGDLAGEAKASIEASFRRLQTDHLDLLQLHTPILDGADGRGLPVSDVIGAVADALDGIKKAGMVDHIGCTGLGDSPAMAKAMDSGRYESVQAYFNIVNPSAGFAGKSGGEQDFDGVIDRAAGHGMGVVNIRVMAGGSIGPERHPNAGDPASSLIKGFEVDRDRQRAVAMQSIVDGAGLESIHELAFRFGLSKPGISTVLVGFSSFEQLEAAIRWAERGGLAANVVDQVLQQASR